MDAPCAPFNPHRRTLVPLVPDAVQHALPRARSRCTADHRSPDWNKASAERKTGGTRDPAFAHTAPSALRYNAGQKPAHMAAVMPIATAATAITAVESQPIRRNLSWMGKSPMIFGFDVICIIVTITGTATTPLMTAVQ